MSVAELPSVSPTGELDRTPPQDIAAEQCVLGGMLLSKDAIADVVEVIRGHDFYRPAHEPVFDAVLDLYGRGEPADAVTVSAELQKRGEIGRVGGAPYLHTLISVGADRGQRRLLRPDRARDAHPAPAGRGRHPDRPARLRRRRRRRRHRRRRPGRDLPRHRAPDVSEDYRPLSAIMRGHARRDRGDRLPRRRDGRRPHRLRRPRRADQRPAPRPDDHRRRAARPWARRSRSTRRCRRRPAGPRWARSPSATSCSARTADRRGRRRHRGDDRTGPATRSSSPTAP